MTSRVRIALLFLGAAILFTVPLFAKDMWTPDESRYAEVSREMMVSGDYLVPHLNGNHYDEKPPLQFWLIALASFPVGQVNGLTGRIPTVVSAMLVLGLVFLLARRMYDDRTAFWSVIILATTFQFWWLAHVGQLDMMLTACTTLSLYSLWRWHESSNGRWFVVFYAGTALGLLTKGPPALLITALGVLAFRWRDQRGKHIAFWVAYPLVLLPVLLWFFAARSGRTSGVSDEMGATLSRQIVGRLFSGLSHAAAPWYYVEKLPLDLFPWFFFLPWVIIFAWRERREGPAMRLLLSWIVPALVFFHLATGKRALYLLPLYPAYAILTAHSLLALMDTNRQRWFRTTACIWGALMTVAVSAPLVIMRTPYKDDQGATWAIASAGAICVAWTIYIVLHGQLKRWPAVLAAQTAVMLLAFTVFVLPTINAYKSARSYCTPVRALVESGPVSVYSLVITRHEYMFYSQTTHEVVLEHPAVSTFGPPDDPKVQRMAERLRRKVEATCDSVPTHDLIYPGPQDRSAIRGAVADVLRSANLNDKQVYDYEREVQAQLLPFVKSMSGSTPVVAYVRREDWKWIAAYLDEPLAFTVIRDEKVSSRNMLLLANEPARRALELRSAAFAHANGASHAS